MQVTVGPARVAVLVATFALFLALSPGSALAGHVQCGDTITQDTTLDSDLDCVGTGIAVGADAITLDLDGHTVRSNSTAVHVPLHNDVSIRGGTLVTQDGTGVLIRGERNRVTDITARGRIGIYLEGATDSIVAGNRVTDASIGIFLYLGFLNVISGNTVARNTGPPPFGFFKPAGISVWQSGANDISRNRMSDNTADIRIAGGGGRIHDNRGQGSEVGVALDSASGAAVTRNRFTRTGTGIAAEHSDDFSLSSGIRIEDNVVSKSLRAGISLRRVVETQVIGNSVTDGRVGIQVLEGTERDRLVGNYASRNAEEGIRVISGLREVVVDGNESHHNGDDGISVGRGEDYIVRRNVANFNADLGIEVLETSFGVDGGGNRAKHNGNPAQCVGVRCK